MAILKRRKNNDVDLKKSLKEAMGELRGSVKGAKEKFDSASPVKQKMIVAGVAAAVAAIATVIGMKKNVKKKK